MLFNSIGFLLFLPFVIAVYFALPDRWRWVLLLTASYFFYACWRVDYLVLIVTSTLVDYGAALRIGAASSRKGRRGWLIASLAVNLGIFFVFKYFNFFMENVGPIMHLVGVESEPPMVRLLLPVGISFYTFQSLSYTIDVYRRHRDPERHLGIFALYVSFFPQLVAGPIERSTRLLPQFHETHRPNYERFRSGVLLIAVGYFKKLVVADRLAVYVDTIYSNPEQYNAEVLLFATYLFTFQIYCDFSGYSDIAIGSARIMGFDLMENFRQPYLSRSIAEYWRRWHISLSTWFRDYVFIPLGGSRGALIFTLFNIAVVFLLSGLWHGAAWTFILWGGLHGAYLIVGRLTASYRERLLHRVLPGRWSALWVPLQVLITFHLVVLGFVIFRAETMMDAKYILSTLFIDLLSGSFSFPQGISGSMDPDWHIGIGLWGVGLLMTVELIQQRYSLSGMIQGLPAVLRWLLYYAIVFGILFFGIFGSQQFIYFQF